jgi:uncharacterized protein (DUF2147 family)
MIRPNSVYALIFLLFTGVASASETDILGTWYTPENKSKVDLYNCANSICGKIVWLQAPLYPDDDPEGSGGKPKVDRNNPEKSLQGRPILGLNILQGFKPSGENKWGGGTVYDPDNGKTYKCKITLKDSNTLEVRGYIGISLIGRTSVWTRQEVQD